MTLSSTNQASYQNYADRVWIRTTDSQPLTLNDVRTLKAKTDSKPDAVSLLKKLAAVTIDETVNCVKDLCQWKANRDDRTCQYNGHLVKHAPADGVSRNCEDCGRIIAVEEPVRITNPAEVANPVYGTTTRRRRDVVVIDTRMLKQRRGFTKIDLSSAN